jgi:uncharacterized RDD family membrane protein YckC
MESDQPPAAGDLWAAAAATPPPSTADGAEDGSWWRRAGAFLVDAGTAIGLGLGIGALLASATDLSDDDATTAAGLFIIVGWVLVTTGVSAPTGGQTLGKLAGGMRVVRDDGRSVGFASSFLRDVVCRLLYLVPLFFVVDSLFAAGERKKTLRDRMVGTRVLRTPAYPRRGAIVAVAAVAAIGLWIATAAVFPTRDDQGFTRSEFVSGCSKEPGSAQARVCGCIYDRLLRRFGRRRMDDLEFASGREADRVQPAIEAAAADC